jgi:SAM-dependent methyltransferase
MSLDALERDDSTLPYRPEAGLALGPLREVLQRADYLQHELHRSLESGRGGHDIDVTTALRQLGGAGPRDTLVKLFLLGVTVSGVEAEDALGGAYVRALLEEGLLRRVGDAVASRVAIASFANLYVAHDFMPAVTGRPAGAELIPRFGSASTMLSRLTLRRPVRTALDLGTGQGLQALLAARHAERVTATDLSARALSFAALSAALNGMPHVACRQGSFYEPVEGERFDLIVANPPFVISPERSFTYRDGGLTGDGVVEHVLRRAPALLEEGGFASVIVNWHHRSMADWDVKPRRWLEGSGCDVLVVLSNYGTPLEYASAWLHDAGVPREEYANKLDAWLAYYERLGVGTLSAGTFLLRKRSAARNWFAYLDGTTATAFSSNAGEQLARVVAARDWIDRFDGNEDRLLDRAYRPADALRASRTSRPLGRQWEAISHEVKHASGLAFAFEVPPNLLRVVQRCDGSASLRSLLVEEATQAEGSPAIFVARCSRLLVDMIKRGFFEPADDDPRA